MVLQVSKTEEVGHTFFQSILVNLKCIAPIVQKIMTIHILIMKLYFLVS